jgi:hypothetical protein
LIWGAHNQPSDAPCAVINHLEKNRAAVLAETYRRWEQRDPAPILPPFSRTARINAKSTSQPATSKGAFRQ